MVKEPKFYQNLADDNHCLQASLMIVLNTLGREVSWEEVNRITEYKDGLYSWTSPATLVLAERVPGTRLISGMDYKQFAERGEEYFKEHNARTPEWFELQKQHASPGFKKEQKAAQMLVQKNLVEQRTITKEDIENLLQNQLLIAVVDAGKLAQETRSAGHFVVIYGQDKEHFILHDPGLPPQKARKVNKILFIEAFQNELIVIPEAGMESYAQR